MNNKLLVIIVLIIIIYYWFTRIRMGDLRTFILPTVPYNDIKNDQLKITRLNTFNDIKHVLFINLDTRPDRRIQTEKELERIGLQPQRIRAIQHRKGALGCVKSHIKCLEHAKENNWDHVMICEDDVQFILDVKLVQDRINTFLNRHKDWDVITLGNVIIKGEYIDDASARVYRALMSTCYIIRKEYYDVLLHNYKITANRFMMFCMYTLPLDQGWFSLQQRDKWYTILPLLAVQRIGKSDIAYVRQGEQRYHILKSVTHIRNYPPKERNMNQISNFDAQM